MLTLTYWFDILTMLFEKTEKNINISSRKIYVEIQQKRVTTLRRVSQKNLKKIKKYC